MTNRFSLVLLGSICYTGFIRTSTNSLRSTLSIDNEPPHCLDVWARFNYSSIVPFVWTVRGMIWAGSGSTGDQVLLPHYSNSFLGFGGWLGVLGHLLPVSCFFITLSTSLSLSLSHSKFFQFLNYIHPISNFAHPST